MNTKLLISIFLVFLIYSHGWSQLSNGTFSIGGNIDFIVGTSKQSYNKELLKVEYTNFSFSPSIDYFLYDNFSFGIYLTYRYRNNDIIQDYSQGISLGSKENLISIGPQVRYYLQYDKKIYPFISLIYQYGNTTTENQSKATYYANEFEISSNEFKFGTGLAIFIFNGLSLEPIIYYDIYDSELSVTYPDHIEKNTYEYRNFNFNIGLKYYIF